MRCIQAKYGKRREEKRREEKDRIHRVDGINDIFSEKERALFPGKFCYPICPININTHQI